MPGIDASAPGQTISVAMDPKIRIRITRQAAISAATCMINCFLLLSNILLLSFQLLLSYPVFFLRIKNIPRFTFIVWEKAQYKTSDTSIAHSDCGGTSDRERFTCHLMNSAVRIRRFYEAAWNKKHTIENIKNSRKTVPGCCAYLPILIWGSLLSRISPSS